MEGKGWRREIEDIFWVWLRVVLSILWEKDIESHKDERVDGAELHVFTHFSIRFLEPCLLIFKSPLCIGVLTLHLGISFLQV